jgi:hypothetical protein
MNWVVFLGLGVGRFDELGWVSGFGIRGSRVI